MSWPRSNPIPPSKSRNFNTTSRSKTQVPAIPRRSPSTSRKERINEKLAEQFCKELRQHAAIPGFPPWSCPGQVSIEKKFATDVRDQVRKQLISESYQQAVTKQDVKVLGEPEFIDPEGIKLPDAGGNELLLHLHRKSNRNSTIPDLSRISRSR